MANIILFAAFVLALYDYLGHHTNVEERMNIGWVIVITNLILMYWLLLINIRRMLIFVAKGYSVDII